MKKKNLKIESLSTAIIFIRYENHHREIRTLIKKKKITAIKIGILPIKKGGGRVRVTADFSTATMLVES